MAEAAFLPPARYLAGLESHGANPEGVDAVVGLSSSRRAEYHTLPTSDCLSRIQGETNSLNCR